MAEAVWQCAVLCSSPFMILLSQSPFSLYLLTLTLGCQIMEGRMKEKGGQGESKGEPAAMAYLYALVCPASGHSEEEGVKVREKKGFRAYEKEGARRKGTEREPEGERRVGGRGKQGI